MNIQARIMQARTGTAMPIPLHLRPGTFLLAALLLGAAPAAAQQSTFQPWPAPTVQPQRPQEPPCLKDFVALREEADKRGKAIQAARTKKVAPQEACRLFNSLASATGKLVKFVDENEGIGRAQRSANMQVGPEQEFRQAIEADKGERRTRPLPDLAVPPAIDSIVNTRLRRDASKR